MDWATKSNKSGQQIGGNRGESGPAVTVKEAVPSKARPHTEHDTITSSGAKRCHTGRGSVCNFCGQSSTKLPQHPDTRAVMPSGVCDDYCWCHWASCPGYAAGAGGRDVLEERRHSPFQVLDASAIVLEERRHLPFQVLDTSAIEGICLPSTRPTRYFCYDDPRFSAQAYHCVERPPGRSKHVTCEVQHHPCKALNKKSTAESPPQLCPLQFN